MFADYTHDGGVFLEIIEEVIIARLLGSPNIDKREDDGESSA